MLFGYIKKAEIAAAVFVLCVVELYVETGEVLGEGAFGSVQTYVSTVTNKEFAVKVGISFQSFIIMLSFCVLMRDAVQDLQDQDTVETEILAYVIQKRHSYASRCVIVILDSIEYFDDV